MHSHKLEAVVQRCSVKKGVLTNFAKLTGKHQCQTLFFDKVAGLRLATLLKKRLWHGYFPVNFAKFLRTPFFTEIYLQKCEEYFGGDQIGFYENGELYKGIVYFLVLR